MLREQPPPGEWAVTGRRDHGRVGVAGVPGTREEGLSGRTPSCMLPPVERQCAAWGAWRQAGRLALRLFCHISPAACCH